MDVHRTQDWCALSRINLRSLLNQEVPIIGVQWLTGLQKSPALPPPLCRFQRIDNGRMRIDKLPVIC